MASPSRIRLLVVDDHPLMRAGICGEIGTQPDMEVVSEAGTGHEAIAAFRAHRPDVTLMDIRMPEIDGIEAMQHVRREFPQARFIVLTTVIGDIQVLRAIHAGAAGYLLKNLLRTELIDTIRLVHAGRRRIPPEVAQQIADNATAEAITSRELEVLRGVSRGQGNKTIGLGLGISEHTVKNHVKSILSKLGASDRTGAVVIAMRRGYLDL